MGCLSSGDLKEEKTYFALFNTLYRIPVLSSRKCPRSETSAPAVARIFIRNLWRTLQPSNRASSLKDVP